MKMAKKKSPVADGKSTIRKRRRQFLPKINKNRSIRKKYFKIMKKMKEEQLKVIIILYTNNKQLLNRQGTAIPYTKVFIVFIQNAHSTVFSKTRTQ